MVTDCGELGRACPDVSVAVTVTVPLDEMPLTVTDVCVSP
jgi:hypothetical protein